MKRLVLAALFAMQAGCHEFVIHNGNAKPAAAPHPSYDDKLHSAIVGDVVMIDQPYRLDAICPNGWARVDRQVTVLDGLISLLGGWIYQADSVTVRCAEGGAAAPAGSAASPPATTAPPSVKTPPPAPSSGDVKL